MQIPIVCFVLLAGCAADLGADPAAPDAGSQSDAAMSAVSDAMAASPDADNPDDISRCAPSARVVWNRNQMTDYSLHYSDTTATFENYPVSQIRPAFGVPGWSGTFVDEVIAIRVRVPASYTASDPSHIGFIHVAEAPLQPVVSRDLCVSAHACDFTPCPSAAVGNTGGVDFSIGTPYPYGQTFQKDQVFWINIRNRNSDYTPSCTYESCGILVDFASPNRY